MRVWEDTEDPSVLADALFLVAMYHPGVIPHALNNAIGVELKGRQTNKHRKRYRTDMQAWRCWVLVRALVIEGLTWERAFARAAEILREPPEVMKDIPEGNVRVSEIAPAETVDYEAETVKK
jgi:hypothetical protein